MTSCKRNYCLLLAFLLALCTSHGETSAVNVVQDDTFLMACYNAGVASTSGFYLEVFFTPNGPTEKVQIARYQPQSGLKDVTTQFSGRLSLTEQQELSIVQMKVPDEGMYECISRGFDVPSDDRSTDVTVYVRPTISVEALNSPLQAGSGEIEAASCSAIGGKPAAAVDWGTERYLFYNSSHSATDGEQQGTINNVTNLIVSPTKFYNKQPFRCTIAHPAFENGAEVLSIDLDVQYSPSIPVIQVINDNTQLRCEADANPEATISWIMPDNNAAPTPTQSSSTVRIISPEDPARQNDTYTCVANNDIAPSTSINITTAEAVRYVEVVKTTNTGLIIGIVFACILILVLIGAAVYWFFIRKHREKDSGPYNPPKKIVRASADEENSWGRSSGRPIIQHANESLNKNAPPSPTHPPPEEDGSDYSQSDVEEFTEGHDVDLNGGQNTEPEDEDMPTTGIVSKNSVNFQHRRKRPSTSPHRASQRNQPQAAPRTPPEISDPHYEVPPKEYYEDDYDGDERLLTDHHHQGHEDPMDDRFYDRPEDRYPGYQPRYDEPPRDEHLPPYSDTIQYASIDHSGYNAGKPRTRPPYHEPVEYAEIRSKGQIV